MFLSVFNQSPIFGVMVILGFVVGITVHEAAHALTAWRLGDDTAYRQGRVTLNPAEHLDPLGSVLLVLAGFGWGKPVPVDTSRIRGGIWGPVAVAFAGPASNLVVLVVCAVLYRLAVFQEGYLLVAIAAFAFTNALLLVFNLIPIPPLDGSKILYPFLPRALNGFVGFMNEYGPYVLLGLILLGYFLSRVPPFYVSPLGFIISSLLQPLYLALALLGVPVPPPPLG